MTEIFHRYLANKIMQKSYYRGTLSVGNIFLSPEESHHLVHVARVRHDEKIIILNGDGQIGHGRFVGYCDKSAMVQIDNVEIIDRPSINITLLQSVLTNNCNDHIVRECTAIGVNKIIFCETQYSECRLAKKIDAKLSRWNTISIESCKQSGNPFLPEILYFKSLHDVVVSDRSIKLFGGLTEHAVPVSCRLKNIVDGDEIVFSVGPEGDFSCSEYEYLRSRGFMECSLGNSVLRSETAAVYSMSVLSNWRYNRSIEK